MKRNMEKVKVLCDAYRHELNEIVSLFNKVGDMHNIKELGEILSVEGCVRDFAKLIEPIVESADMVTYKAKRRDSNERLYDIEVSFFPTRLVRIEQEMFFGYYGACETGWYKVFFDDDTEPFLISGVMKNKLIKLIKE